METITSSGDIAALFDEGSWYKTPSVTLIVGHTAKRTADDKAEEHDLPGRVAFIAGKKGGNAVWRNAAKRRMRAICHDLGGPWQGYEVIFLAKRGITERPYQEVLDQCRKRITSITRAKRAVKSGS